MLGRCQGCRFSPAWAGNWVGTREVGHHEAVRPVVGADSGESGQAFRSIADSGARRRLDVFLVDLIATNADEVVAALAELRAQPLEGMPVA